MSQGIHKFFLRCDPEARFFYAVEIHPDRASFLAAMRRLRGRPLTGGEKSATAVCLRYLLNTPNKELQKKHDQIGTLFFVDGQFSPSEAAHELAHAAIGWAKRSGIDPRKQSRNYDKCPEERFARCLQRMHKEFFSHLDRPKSS